MGSSSSKAKVSSQELAEEQRRKEMQRHGILIPPSFGANPLGAASSSWQGQWPTHPSYLQYLHLMDPSQRLLAEFMQPGLWITTRPSGNTLVRASLALPPSYSSPTTTSTSPPPPTPPQGQLYAERETAAWVTQLRADSATGNPSGSVSVQVWPHLGWLFAHVDHQGLGWVGGYLDLTRQPGDATTTPTSSLSSTSATPRYHTEMSIKAGCWQNLDWKALVSGNSSNTSWDQILAPPKDQNKMHGYMAMNFLGATTAVETALNWHTLDTETRTYLSMNMSELDHPPLYLSLERTPAGQASISLTQIMNYDRWQFNPWEDRAPFVRNTMAWTIRMETTPSTLTKRADTVEPGEARSDLAEGTPRMMEVSVGAAWQLNRAVAVKAVLQPQRNQITAAVLFKRWKQPRLTCSLLQRYDWSLNRFSFLGVGLDLETGALSSPTLSPDQSYNYHYGPRFSVDQQDDAPETKATLPSDP